ncbi:MAG: site-specific integrase [Ruminococcus sp.]
MKFLLNETDLNKMGIILALYTGIRLGELCALKWENICFDSNIIRIRHTMQRIQNNSINSTQKTKIIITEPKSLSSMRDIPLPKCIVEIVRRFQSNPENYILTGNNFEFVEPRTMQNRFKKIIKDSGIEDKNFHVLRHTFATRCVEQGFETKSLSEILGHSNVNITLNRYVHSSLQLKRDNMDKLKL